jgi:ferredoxin
MAGRMQGKTAMALIIDTSRCQGHGRCALINPDLFDVNDDGYGVVLNPAPTGDARADADRAIGNCPEQAIGWAGDGPTSNLR